MKLLSNLSVLFIVIFCCCNVTKNNKTALATIKENVALIGYAADVFKVDGIVEKDPLNDENKFKNNWIIQQSNEDANLERYTKIVEGKLEVEDPRGCTIWYKKKLQGAMMISYKVTAPSSYTKGNDIMPRDINQFWMANTATDIDVNAKGGLFDAEKFDGGFKAYDELNTYYASTGGGNVTNNNRTTRFRQYPRSVNGKLSNHLALNDKDDQSEFLIAPNKEHTIQLVAANDIVQYIFDGKIVYQIKSGDTVELFNDGTKQKSKAVWGSETFKIYNEGYFGFRLTRTHHTYSDFKVYRLIKK
jgi:hypothetical protein